NLAFLSSCTQPSLTCTFFFARSAAHRDLHSFPTRRSSDLHPRTAAGRGVCAPFWPTVPPAAGARPAVAGLPRARTAGIRPVPPRSEEHTSELQSRENLVCRLLLEKKKQHKQQPAKTESVTA